LTRVDLHHHLLVGVVVVGATRVVRVPGVRRVHWYVPVHGARRRQGVALWRRVGAVAIDDSDRLGVDGVAVVDQRESNCAVGL